jgi:Rrf2 family protein
MESQGFCRGQVWRASEPPNHPRGEDVLTKKGKYGLKAMVHLAGLEPNALAQVADIAQANNISKGFLDQILTELRRAGLVYSKHGKRGGYALARPADEISVGNIVRVLDGPLAPIGCASVTAYRACDDCGDLRKCAVRLVMVEARNAVAHVLDNFTLAEMRGLKEPLQLADMYDI